MKFHLKKWPERSFNSSNEHPFFNNSCQYRRDITSYILTLGEALVRSGHKVWVASSGGDCVPRLEAAGIRMSQINIRTKSEAHPKIMVKFAR